MHSLYKENAYIKVVTIVTIIMLVVALSNCLIHVFKYFCPCQSLGI